MSASGATRRRAVSVLRLNSGSVDCWQNWEVGVVGMLYYWLDFKEEHKERSVLSSLQ